MYYNLHTGLLGCQIFYFPHRSTHKIIQPAYYQDTHQKFINIFYSKYSEKYLRSTGLQYLYMAHKHLFIHIFSIILEMNRDRHSSVAELQTYH